MVFAARPVRPAVDSTAEENIVGMAIVDIPAVGMLVGDIHLRLVSYTVHSRTADSGCTNWFDFRNMVPAVLDFADSYYQAVDKMVVKMVTSVLWSSSFHKKSVACLAPNRVVPSSSYLDVTKPEVGEPIQRNTLYLLNLPNAHRVLRRVRSRAGKHPSYHLLELVHHPDGLQLGEECRHCG